MSYIKKDPVSPINIRETGRSLKEFRRSNKIQAKDLALASGISLSKFYALEKGKSRLSKKMALRLIAGYKSLNIPAQWIEILIAPRKPYFGRVSLRSISNKRKALAMSKSKAVTA